MAQPRNKETPMNLESTHISEISKDTETGKYWFHTEDEDVVGPFDTKADAYLEFVIYCRHLNGEQNA